MKKIYSLIGTFRKFFGICSFEASIDKGLQLSKKQIMTGFLGCLTNLSDNRPFYISYHSCRVYPGTKTSSHSCTKVIVKVTISAPKKKGVLWSIPFRFEDAQNLYARGLIHDTDIAKTK